MILAHFQPVLFKEALERRSQEAHIEDRLDRATIRARADERAIGALAES